MAGRVGRLSCQRRRLCPPTQPRQPPADFSPRFASPPAPAELASDIVGFLQRCQAPTGGFGGGPGQQAHLATTYAVRLSAPAPPPRQSDP